MLGRVLDATSGKLAERIAFEQLKVLETSADARSVTSVTGRLESVVTVLKNLFRAVGADASADVDAGVAAQKRSADLEPLRLLLSSLRCRDPGNN